MTDREHFEFESFCTDATNNQLINIMNKEKEFADIDPFRKECYRIAKTIARLRGLEV